MTKITKLLTLFVLYLGISMTSARKLRGLGTEPDNSLTSKTNGDLVLDEHDFTNIEEGIMEDEGEFGYENVNEYEWILDENGEEVLIDDGMKHVRSGLKSLDIGGFGGFGSFIPVVPVVTAVPQLVGGAVEGAVNTVGGVVGGAVNTVGGVVEDVGSAIGSAASDVADALCFWC